MKNNKYIIDNLYILSEHIIDNYINEFNNNFKFNKF